MQTFLPYTNFQESAKVLDRARLGKQRVECKQIYEALTRGSRWSNHPAVLMWAGYESCLINYWWHMCREWISRGYKDTIMPELITIAEIPWWLGNEHFHASHRAALLAKMPDHYEQFGWVEKPVINYWWPTKKGQKR